MAAKPSLTYTSTSSLAASWNGPPAKATYRCIQRLAYCANSNKFADNLINIRKVSRATETTISRTPWQLA
ncbi:hypothetical protein GCM10007047_00640 [Cerasicoccus arenae]|uniref:Uncharacterized protein n=1 Tax=Cerasicoccus arenae TaxID=424488 RepID=A0A8J3D6I4_9BACT|nr:hypothetical protein GCM10007047_00640 [Cerasicoccus arenae]